MPNIIAANSTKRRTSSFKYRGRRRTYRNNIPKIVGGETQPPVPSEFALDKDDKIVKICNEIYSKFGKEPNKKQIENKWKSYPVVATNEESPEIPTSPLPPTVFGRIASSMRNFFIKPTVNLKQSKLNELVELATKLMKKNGYTVKENPVINVELHVANSTGGKVVGSSLTKHIDDDGGVKAKLNTLIIYLVCNVEDGGNLTFYFNDKGKINEMNVTPTNNLAVLFRGDIVHYPFPILNGDRVAVTVQLERDD